jgi:hypothetical protein
VSLTRTQTSSDANQLGELRRLSTVSVAELLVEVGDVRRFTIGGFARFNGTAPLAASTAEGPGEPIRHLQPGRQPPRERDPVPDGGHLAALRAARQDDLCRRARQWTHQEGGAPHPQTPSVRCRLSPHDPRPGPPRPPRRLTPLARPDAVKVERPTGRTILTAPGPDGAKLGRQARGEVPRHAPGHDRYVVVDPRMPAERLTARRFATRALRVTRLLALSARARFQLTPNSTRPQPHKPAPDLT